MKNTVIIVDQRDIPSSFDGESLFVNDQHIFDTDEANHNPMFETAEMLALGLNCSVNTIKLTLHDLASFMAAKRGEEAEFLESVANDDDLDEWVQGYDNADVLGAVKLKDEYEPLTGVIHVLNVCGYKVLADCDCDGHLLLTVDHKDGSQVVDTEMDVASSEEQWAARFTTKSIEAAYVETNSKTIQVNENNVPVVLTCPVCKVDLTKPLTVARVYINKDGGKHVHCSGSYDKDGFFESDLEVSFSGKRVDLLDDSDTCAMCDAPL